MKIVERFRTKLRFFLALCCALCATPSAFAHGLDLSSAQVTLRWDNHISIKIQTPIAAMFNQLDWESKPDSLQELLSIGDAQVDDFAAAIRLFFEEQMPATVGGKPLESRRVVLGKSSELRKQLQAVLANTILNSHLGDAEHDRDNYLQVVVEAFVPRDSGSRDLAIHFPKELGEIVVTYVKPLQQTLKPDSSGSIFQVEML